MRNAKNILKGQSDIRGCKGITCSHTITAGKLLWLSIQINYKANQSYLNIFCNYKTKISAGIC